MLRRRPRGRHAGRPGRRGAEPPADSASATGSEDAHDSGPDAADGWADADAVGATGPWDAGDAPDDSVARIDLGGLRVPTRTGVELRVEADPDGGVSGVLLVYGHSAVQLGAFAAPRSEGIWDEVRAEIAAGLEAGGSAAEERDGEFGPELWARVVGPEGVQPLRFVGVEGPRWLLRVVYTGREATEPDPTSLLAESVRDVVVVRGDEALPVRAPLPLRLPQDVVEGVAAGAEGAAEGTASNGRPRFAASRRGPEITETR